MEKMSLEQLDKEMKALGMIPASAMINGNPIMAHCGVTDMEKFEQWLNMRHEEMLKFKARMIIKGQEDNELYEWALAYHAALAEVLTNFNQAKGKI